MQQEPTYVGIDVAKEMLDVALRPSGECWRVAHDAAGLEQLVARLQALEPVLVVLEASGGLELELVAALAAAQLPVVVVNPRQTRESPARPARWPRPTPSTRPCWRTSRRPCGHQCERFSDARTQALRELLTRRRQLVGMRVAEGQRLTRAGAAVRPGIEAHRAWLEQQLSALEDELRQALQQSPVWRERDQLLRSVPGVGEQLSLTLLAELPELGRLDRRQVRRAGRRGAVQPRQRPTARATHDLGRTRAGARDALHGRTQRQPPQSGDPRLLLAPAGGRQAEEAGAHRLHAQAARDPSTRCSSTTRPGAT